MKRTYSGLAAALLFIAPLASAQPLVNLGLVGVGRLPADSFDQMGPGVDTLGGLFSGMWLDASSLSQTGSTYYATIYALPDRGFGDGLQDYHPRVQRLSFSITPYYGPGPAPQDQITFSNTATLLLKVDGSFFTGANPDDTNVMAHPQSLADGIGRGKWSLDAEGIAYAPDGTWYISDEYGPFLYHFNPMGELLEALVPPDAYVPKSGPTYPRATNYLTASTIATEDSGRYINRGLEGLSITPSGKKLVTVLQSPLVQDGENRNPSRNTRLLLYDIDPQSPTYHQPLAEYVHVLPLSAAEANNRHTPVSEVLALSDTQFLILQRDSRGLGGDAGGFLYKRIVMVDVSNASNLLGTGYDLEKGAPGQLSLPRSGLPSNVVAAVSHDLVDLLNPTQLAKYGLNLAVSNQNANTVSEKWEGLAAIPLNDSAAPHDYLLLVGNDNDFKASLVYHNGVVVGTNAFTVDMILLAFRIGEDHIPPTLTCPAEITVAATTNCALPSIAPRLTATDNSAAPLTFLQDPAPGAAVTLGLPLAVTVTAQDAAGNRSSSCTVMVTVTDQTSPKITCSSNIVVEFDGAKGAKVTYAAPTVTENCSAVAVACLPPAGSSFPIGSNIVTCAAMDESGNMSSCAFVLTVQGPFTVKSNVLAGLTALNATVTDKHTRQKLDKVMEHLQQSLSLDLWLDQTHLQSKGGEKVFDREKEAVNELQGLLKDKKAQLDDALVQGFIVRLGRCDRTLAETAIIDAISSKGDTKKIANAQNELAAGDRDAAGRKYPPAIDHYRNAWRKALEAGK
jgi:hypothetical protein